MSKIFFYREGVLEVDLEGWYVECYEGKFMVAKIKSYEKTRTSHIISPICDIGAVLSNHYVEGLVEFGEGEETEYHLYLRHTTAELLQRIILRLRQDE